MPIAGETELSAISKDPQALLRIPVGVASPLWGLFAGAAMTGAAWWWMTRWTRPANLEAMFGAGFGAAGVAGANGAAKSAALAAPALEAIEDAPATLEAAVETFEPAPEPAVTETLATVIENTPPAPIAEALTEAAPQAVGGEAAPISPVLEALAPEIVEPTIESASPVETAIDVLADVAPESKPALKAKKPTPPKAD